MYATISKIMTIILFELFLQEHFQSDSHTTIDEFPCGYSPSNPLQMQPVPFAIIGQDIVFN